MASAKEIGSNIGAFIIFIIVVVVFGLISLGRIVAMFGANDSPDPYYDSTEEQDALDRQMRDWVKNEEREQKAREAQDAYDDYQEWVRSGSPSW